MATNGQLSESNEDITTPGHREPSAVAKPAVRSDLDGRSFMEKDMR